MPELALFTLFSVWQRDDDTTVENVLASGAASELIVRRELLLLRSVSAGLTIVDAFKNKPATRDALMSDYRLFSQLLPRMTIDIEQLSRGEINAIAYVMNGLTEHSTKNPEEGRRISSMRSAIGSLERLRERGTAYAAAFHGAFGPMDLGFKAMSEEFAGAVGTPKNPSVSTSAYLECGIQFASLKTVFDSFRVQS